MVLNHTIPPSFSFLSEEIRLSMYVPLFGFLGVLIFDRMVRKIQEPILAMEPTRSCKLMWKALYIVVLRAIVIFSIKSVEAVDHQFEQDT